MTTWNELFSSMENTVNTNREVLKEFERLLNVEREKRRAAEN